MDAERAREIAKRYYYTCGRAGNDKSGGEPMIAPQGVVDAILAAVEESVEEHNAIIQSQGDTMAAQGDTIEDLRAENERLRTAIEDQNKLIEYAFNWKGGDREELHALLRRYVAETSNTILRDFVAGWILCDRALWGEWSKRCMHRWHETPLITPCPQCGEGRTTT